MTAGPPFSNGTEGDAWMANWCERCLRDAPFRNGISNTGCPLLLIALDGYTPAEWIVDQPFQLGHQYRCTEFRAAGYRNPGPDPLPEPQAMDGLFPRPSPARRALTGTPVERPGLRPVITPHLVGGLL